MNRIATTAADTSTSDLIAFAGDRPWYGADERTRRPHLISAASVALALPAAPNEQYTGLQLAGGECAVHNVDPGVDVPLNPWAITPDGDVLHACSTIPCPPAAETLPPGVRHAGDAIRAALAAADWPHDTAHKLILTVVETTGDVDPFCDQSEWTNRERASNPLYAAVDALIAETVRRHVEGAQADGLTPAEAARDIQVGLFASIQLAIAQYTRPELFAAPGEEDR